MVDNDEGIKRLVDRFLSWPLPKSVRSDMCATMDYSHARSGTNLLTADEARQMLQYLLADEGVSSLDRLNTVVQAADLLCEEIRASGTHSSWKQLAHALDALSEADEAYEQERHMEDVIRSEKI